MSVQDELRSLLEWIHDVQCWRTWLVLLHWTLCECLKRENPPAEGERASHEVVVEEMAAEEDDGVRPVGGDGGHGGDGCECHAASQRWQSADEGYQHCHNCGVDGNFLLGCEVHQPLVGRECNISRHCVGLHHHHHHQNHITRRQNEWAFCVWSPPNASSLWCGGSEGNGAYHAGSEGDICDIAEEQRHCCKAGEGDGSSGAVPEFRLEGVIENLTSCRCISPSCTVAYNSSKHDSFGTVSWLLSTRNCQLTRESPQCCSNMVTKYFSYRVIL